MIVCLVYIIRSFSRFGTLLGKKMGIIVWSYTTSRDVIVLRLSDFLFVPTPRADTGVETRRWCVS